MDETSPQNRYQGAVRESIQKAAKRNSAYMLMSTLTTVIACYGLFANSAAIVIGAMRSLRCFWVRFPEFHLDWSTVTNRYSKIACFSSLDMGKVDMVLLIQCQGPR